MEKIEGINSREMGCFIESYVLNEEIMSSNIVDYVESLKKCNLKLFNFRLSNSERDNEYFYKTFLSLREFENYTWNDDYFIDDFGVSCLYNNVVFHLTFNFDNGRITVFHRNNIDFKPFLLAIEADMKKKIR